MSNGNGLPDVRKGREHAATDANRQSREIPSSQGGNYLPHLILRENNYNNRPHINMNKDNMPNNGHVAFPGGAYVTGHGAFITGGLDSPFTISENDLADVDYDQYEDMGKM